jgi:hypothetical protein
MLGLRKQIFFFIRFTTLVILPTLGKKNYGFPYRKVLGVGSGSGIDLSTGLYLLNEVISSLLLLEFANSIE